MKTNEHSKKLFPVILAGGSGSRFWPLSRESSPKQLLKIFGDKTMLEHTLSRARKIAPPENAVIVTNRQLKTDIQTQLSMFDKKRLRPHLLVEPSARNTAPAIALAAFYIAELDPNAVMIVMPADHYIKEDAKFVKYIDEAVKVAEQGYLVTLGIVPNRPETGFGYIKAGKAFENKQLYPNTRLVEHFVEKPILQKAEEYLADGTYAWNSGVFIWTAKHFLTAVKKHLPATYNKLEIAKEFIGQKNEKAVLDKVYESMSMISVDYAILEKGKNLAMIEADLTWNDVGSWNSLYEISAKDSEDNVTMGSVVSKETTGCLIYGDKRLIATVGVKDLIIVDTEDATLVCSREHSQVVGKVFDHLKLSGHSAYKEHPTVKRPWGKYTVLEKGKGFKVKAVSLEPGQKLSLQLHQRRSEHWVIVEGQANITIGDRSFTLEPNESTFVPMVTKHCLENKGKTPLVLIEVQSGEYLGEDDIIRFDDDYGRVDPE